MQSLRVSTLQGCAAAFCVFTGTVMLVIPHQFTFLESGALMLNLQGMGFLFLMAGVLLYSLAVLAPTRNSVLVLHLFSALLLFYLALRLGQAGAWISLLNYSLLGLSLLLGAQLPRSWKRVGRSAGDLFSLVTGASAALTGLYLLLFGSDDLITPIYNLEQPLSLAFGLVFLACGLALIAIQVPMLRKGRRDARRSRQPASKWAVYLLTAGVFLAFLATAALSNRFWVAAAYFGIFAAELAALPWLETRWDRFSPASLHTRLAMVLALATGLPLILTVAQILGLEEASVRAEALRRQESQATALAGHIADEIQSHQAAVNALSALPGLIDLPAEDQRRQLLVFARAYPEVNSFTLYDAQGDPLASTNDKVPGSSIAGDPNYEIPRRTGRPNMELLPSPALGRPVFGFAAPVLDSQGQFAGLATASLETASVAEILHHSGEESDHHVYLVDGHGRTIVHPDASLAARFADLSGSPPVQALLSGLASAGYLSFNTDPTEEQLAGYSRVPGLGWGVVVERPAAEVLADVHQGRELAFVFLLVFLPLTVLGGYLLAGRMAAPLHSLSQALSELPAGNTEVPLTRSSFLEVERLAQVFGEMRDRLARRTAEREEALQALHRSKDELELRVAERTAALRQSEEENRRQRELLQAVLETDPSGIAVLVGEELRFQFANQAYRQLTPHPKIDPVDRTFAEIWPQEEAFRGRWLLQRVLVSEKPFDIDHYVQEYPDGSTRYFSMSIRRLNWDGETAALLVLWETTAVEVARMIAQEAAEEAQRRAAEAEESQRILGAIMEYIPEGLAIAEGPEIRIQRISQYGAKLSSHSRNELEGMLLKEQLKEWKVLYSDGTTAMPAEDYPLARAILKGSTIQNEEVVIVQNGRVVHLLCNAGPVRDRTGKITGSVMAWKDITERKQVERLQARLLSENYRQRQLLERLVREAPVGICLLEGPEYRYTLVNPAYQAYTSGKGELVGHTVAKVWADDADQFLPILDRVYQTGEAFYGEDVPFHLVRDGRPEDSFFTFSYTPLYDAQGRVEDILMIALETTEQVSTRQQAEAERARLKALVENAPEGIVMSDREGCILLANPAAEELYGRPIPFGEPYNRQASLQLCDLDGKPYDPRSLPLVRSALDAEVYREHEMLIRWPDGQLRSLLVNTAPIYDAHGLVTGAVGIFQDITARKQMEQQLREREAGERARAEELEALMDAVPAIVWIARDPECRVVTGNRAANEMLRMPPGSNQSVTSQPEDSPRHFRVFKDGIELAPHELPLQVAAAQGIEIYDFGETIVFDDGVTRHIFGNVTPLLDDRGMPRGAVGAFTDVTRLLEAEQALRLSEAKFQGVFEANLVPMLFWHLDGRVLDANDAFLKLVGYSWEELRDGQVRLDAMTPAEYLPQEQQAIDELKASRSFTPYEKEYLRRDGRRVAVLIGGILLPGSEDQGVTFAVDLTERRQAEEVVRKYAIELERSNRDLQDFAFIASHDLQEPLRKIQAFGNRLKGRASGKLDEEAIDYLERMQNAAARMQKMIRDLLDYSRVTTRAQPFVPTDLNQVLQEVLSDLEVRLESTNGQVEWQELPFIEADPMQMRQLFQNLIHNGLKFHHPEVSPIVKVYGKILDEWDSKEKCLQLYVEDNGIGFDEEFLERIFQPFQRLHGRSEYEGSGIGLAICRKIVERHRGSITARSAEGQGATFLITLPVEQNGNDC